MKIYIIGSVNINGRKDDFDKFDKDSINLYISSNTVSDYYSNKCRIPIESINIEFINNRISSIIRDRAMIKITELKDEITIHPISNFKKNQFDVKIKFEIIDLNITEKIVDGFKLIYKDNSLIGYYDVNNRYQTKSNFGSYNESEVIKRLKEDQGKKKFESTIRDEFTVLFDELNEKLSKRCGVKVNVSNVLILNKTNDALLGSFKY